MKRFGGMVFMLIALTFGGMPARAFVYTGEPCPIVGKQCERIQIVRGDTWYNIWRTVRHGLYPDADWKRDGDMLTVVFGARLQHFNKGLDLDEPLRIGERINLPLPHRIALAMAEMRSEARSLATEVVKQALLINTQERANAELKTGFEQRGAERDTLRAELAISKTFERRSFLVAMIAIFLLGTLLSIIIAVSVKYWPRRRREEPPGKSYKETFGDFASAG